MLFSPNRRRKPGPKGPSAELIDAVVDMKQRNPRWGCPRIAQQIAPINSIHYRVLRTASVAEFVEVWKNNALTQHKQSTQLSTHKRKPDG
jgi:hypothetical protein